MLRSTIFIVFLAKLSFVELKECKLKKNRNLPKLFFVFFGVLFFSLFLFFFLEKKPPNSILLQL